MSKIGKRLVNFCQSGEITPNLVTLADMNNNNSSMSCSIKLAFHSNMRNVCKGLSRLPFPSFVALNGAAYGGGAELALAADFRVAAQEAALHLWQGKWGLPGGWNGMARLRSLCPFLTSRKVALLFAAQCSLRWPELLRWNLIDFTIDPSNLNSPNLPHEPNNATDANYTNKFNVQALHCIQQFSVGFLNTPAPLRKELLNRALSCDVREHSENAEDADQLFFESHWESETHKSRVANFGKPKIM